jgi:hypothetical protein
MIIFGTIFVIYCSILYITINPVIFENQKELIFSHLDGNQILFDNFLNITRIRGILKLDFLLNLEFITCLIFMMLSEQVFNPTHVDNLDIPFWVPWAVIAALFALITYSNYKGAMVTVS